MPTNQELHRAHHLVVRKSLFQTSRSRDVFVSRRQRINERNQRSDRRRAKKIVSLDMVSRVSSLFDGDFDLDSPLDGFPNDFPELDLPEKWLQLQQSTRLSRPSKDGLSNIYQNILSRCSGRQRFVTGKDPLLITVEENPTRRWIKNMGTASILVNGTSVEKSLASVEKFHWVEDDERRQLLDQYAMVSMELIGEIHMKKPGYINVLPTSAAGSTAAVRRATGVGNSWNRYQNSAILELPGKKKWQEPYHDRLWVSGFSLAGQVGYIHSVDVHTGHIASVNSRTARAVLWPNEAGSVPNTIFDNQKAKEGKKSTSTNSVEKDYAALNDALLVSDGFLVPGKDKGGLYLVKNPGNPDSEWTVCLTGGHHHMVGPETANMGWFYHRSVWVDLTGDGRKSIMTARAKVSNRFSTGGESGNNMVETQLLWLEQPKPPRHDTISGTPLEEDGTIFDPFSSRHLPWKSHVLSEGADVMFNIADLDTEDDTVEVIASHFFGHKVTLTSIRRGTKPCIVFERTIDDKCGAAFGSILVDLDCHDGTCSAQESRIIVDSGSTVMTRKPGDTFSHILVTSHECRIKEVSATNRKTDFDNPRNGLDALSFDEEECYVDGGSLFAYRVPDGSTAWKTEPWIRTTVASGFTVAPKLDNMINPGAPGFVYAFHPKKAGSSSGKRPLIAIAGDCSESAYILRPIGDEENKKNHPDPSARYKLMAEIQCGATVGSIGIGYDDFLSVEQENDYAKLYIPLFEKDKILVFAMGSGVDPDYGEDGGW